VEKFTKIWESNFKRISAFYIYKPYKNLTIVIGAPRHLPQWRWGNKRYTWHPAKTPLSITTLCTYCRVVILRGILPSVVTPSIAFFIVMLIVVMISYDKCCPFYYHGECHYAEYRSSMVSDGVPQLLKADPKDMFPIMIRRTLH
jgi:hypothetical protein